MERAIVIGNAVHQLLASEGKWLNKYKESIKQIIQNGCYQLASYAKQIIA